MTTFADTRLSRSDRLDRLPFTREHGRLVRGFRRQLELARSLPGASVHSVEGNHFAFSRYDVFVPVLLEACHTVVGRVDDQETTL